MEERVSHAAGLSTVVADSKNNCTKSKATFIKYQNVLQSSQKKIARNTTKTNINQYEEGVLRRNINNYFPEEKSVQVKGILEYFKDKNDYAGKYTSLRNIRPIRKIVFSWKKTKPSRSLQMKSEKYEN
jgi:hypothetical protein